jgi:hypothetical protein
VRDGDVDPLSVPPTINETITAVNGVPFRVE